MAEQNYAFKPITEYEPENIKILKRPSYKKIQIGSILLLSILYMISQVISQYCTSNGRNILQKLGVMDYDQFYLLYDAVLCIVCILVNVFGELSTENDLLKLSCILTLIQCQVIICLIVFEGNIFSNLNVNNTLQIIYGIITGILGGCGYTIAKLACFSYMFKCLPNNADNGIIFSIFNSFHICLQVLDTVLNTFDLYNILIMCCCSVLIIIVYLCYDKLLLVPSFDQIELSVQEIIKIHSKQIKYTELNQNKINKLKNWARFYVFMIFRSVNGLIILILFATCACNNYFFYQYMDIFKQTLYTNQTPYKINLYVIFIKLEQVLLNIFSSFCIGIALDFFKMQHKMQGILKILSFTTCIELIALSFMKCADFSISYVRDSFIVLVILIYGQSTMIAMMCAFILFNGNKRIIICFMFGIKYFVSFFDQILENFAKNTFASVYYVFFVLILTYISFVFVSYKTKEAENKNNSRELEHEQQ
ncbi:Conserved_hypothetical protein [Hexamita inflata]|uniref:Uncharacterized protein n=1 Tax=Hexamita inflata TaxID=28002 RepID=A0ABP1HUT4_9EUKA